MITYQIEPIPVGEASKIKAWLATNEAITFRACVVAQMNQNYCDAINSQTQPAENSYDYEKFNIQARGSLTQAGRLLEFLRVFDELASDGYGFHKIKINT